MPPSPWMRRFGEALAPYGGALLDLLYPPLCLSCDQPVAHAAQPLCHRCLKELERAEQDAVESVLAALPDRSTLTSGTCLWLFDKGGTLQKVQHALKYGNRPRYGVLLGRLAATALPLPSHADVVVPVPLHRARLLERGYNQSTALGRGIAETLDVPLLEALKRPRVTVSQTHLSRDARWQNVRDAFAVPKPGPIRRAHVLLVDDVLTTGATAAAAAGALVEAGAASVHLVALAMARH